MALDPHPDREPGMDARVIVVRGDFFFEYAKSNHPRPGPWYPLADNTGTGSPGPMDWPELASRFPNATVVLP